MIWYLAHPIDAMQQDNGVLPMLRQTESILGARKIAFYKPSSMVGNAMDDPEATRAIQLYAIERCDAMLALWPPGASSIGVPIEIKDAVDMGIPVAVVGGAYSLTLKALGVTTFQEIEGAVSFLIEQIEKQQVPKGILTQLMQSPKIFPAVAGSAIPTGSSVQYRDDDGSPPLPSIELKWKGDPECEPRKHYEGDAGWDLIVERDCKIVVGGFFDVPHGIHVELPHGYWGLVTGRSSTIRKLGIHVANGIIDNGYRGELFAACQNVGQDMVTIERGMRIAQLIPFRLESSGMTTTRVAELSESDRGTSAFGSTGR